MPGDVARRWNGRPVVERPPGLSSRLKSVLAAVIGSLLLVTGLFFVLGA